MYIEITDINQIKQAQKEMSAKLNKQFLYKKKRVIGWPSGHFSAEVKFTSKKEGGSYWWYTLLSKDGQSVYNLFGRGDPNDSKVLLIDLQFNFPVASFNRKQGGVFIQELSSGKIVLGHRGIVTRGKSRVPRELLLQEANVTQLTIASDKSPNEIDVLLVSPIDDAHLGKLICDFAIEVRRAAYLVMDKSNDVRAPNIKKNNNGFSTNESPLDSALKDYYDEFIGKSIVRRASQVTMNCRHGSVVKALREELINKGAHYKSVAMDLVVETEKEVFLYEVKTGADSQSIYTGIGQLYFHAASLTRQFPGKPVTRFLVIPCTTSAKNREKVCKELGIKIITFKLNGQSVSINK